MTSTIIGPFHIIFIISSILVFLLYSIYLIIKNERGYLQFFWLIGVIFIPFLASIIYIFKHFVEHRTTNRVQ